MAASAIGPDNNITMDTTQKIYNKGDNIIEDYQKAGAGGSEGNAFQVKINMVYFLNCLIKRKEFKLATEMSQKDVGKFDDLVVLYDNKSILLQAKHSSSKQDKKITMQKMFSTVDNDFMIAKYLHSYLDNIKHNSKLVKVKQLILFSNLDINMKSFNNCIAETCEQKLPKMILPREYYYHFTQDAHEQLKHAVMSYHTSVLSKEVSNNILYKKNMKLSWYHSDLYNLTLFLLCNTFEIVKENENYLINKFKPNSIDGFHDELLMKCLSDFKQEVKSKTKSVCSCTDSNEIHKPNKIQIEGYTEETNTFELSCEIDNDIKEFCALFVLAVKQPNVDGLDTVITRLVREYPLFRGLPVDSVIKNLISDMTKWSDSKSGKYLDQDSGTQLLQNIYLQEKSRQYVLSNNPLQINYREESLKDLRSLLGYKADTLKTSLDDLSSSNITSISSPCGAEMLTTKLYQAFTDCNFIYLDLKDFESKDFVNIIKKCDNVAGYVINCVTSEIGEADTYNNIEHISEAVINKNVHLIFVTSRDGDELEDTLEEIFHETLVEIVEDVIHFGELTEKSQMLIMSNKIIDFQGSTCSLLDVVGEPVLNIEDSVLHELTNKVTLSVGQIPQGTWEMSEAYTMCSQDVDIQRFVHLVSEESVQYNIAVSGVESVHINGVTSLRNMKIKQLQEELIPLLNNDVNKVIIKRNFNRSVNGKSEGSIVIFSGEIDKFRRLCKNSTRVTFWLELRKISSVVSVLLKNIYNFNYYINRPLKHIISVEINKKTLLNIVNSNRDVSFIISGVKDFKVLSEVLQVSKGVIGGWSDDDRIIIVEHGDEGSEQFHDACKRLPTVHWLYLEKMKLMWKKSQGSLDLIRESEKQWKVYEEKDFVRNVTNSLVILSDDAGMGKSSILTKLSHILRDNNRWVVRINFKDTAVRHGLEALSGRNVTTENVLKFLCNMEHLKLRSSTAKYLLKWYLELKTTITKKLIFILDGWDEVPSHIKKTAENFLDYLIRNTGSTVYLATRPHSAFSVENDYSVLATKFKVLPMIIQHKCLVDHWFNLLVLESTDFNKNVLQFKAKKVFKRLQKNVKGVVKFVGNPLYLRFVADIYLDKIRTDEYLLESDFDTLNLYKSIIEIKYNVYFKEKKPHITVGSDDYKMIKDKLNETHSSIALKKLFPQHSSVVNIKVDENIRDYMDDLMLAGILYSSALTDSGDYEFVHKTFTEYYCALYLINGLKQAKDSSEYNLAMNNIIKECYSISGRDDPHKVLKSFVDSLLVEEFPLHRAIFLKDMEKVTDIINQDITIPEKDMLGRTPLHYAVVYGNREIIRELWKTKWKELCVDDLKKTPLHYGCRYLDMFEYLLSLCTDHCHFTNTDCKFQFAKCEMLNEKDIYGRTVLNYAVENNDNDLIKCLLHYGININCLCDSEIVKFGRKYSAYITFPVLLHMPIDIILCNNIDIMVFTKCDGCRIIELLTQWLPPETEENCQILCKVFDRITSSMIYGDVVTTWTDDDHFKFFQYRLDIVDHKISKITYKFHILKVIVKCHHVNTLKYLINHKRCHFSNTAISFIKMFVNSYNVNVCHVLYLDLIYLIMHYDIDNYFTLCSKNQSINIFNGRSLALAVRYGKLSLVQYICSHNVIDFTDRDEEGRTLLHVAAATGRVDVFKYIVNSRDEVCDIMNFADSHNKSALDYVIEKDGIFKCDSVYSDWFNRQYDKEVFCNIKERIMCVKYLREHGAKFNYYDCLNNCITLYIDTTPRTVNTVRIDGRTLLGKAIEMKCDLLILYVFLLGADLKDINPLTLEEFYSIYQYRDEKDIDVRDIVIRAPLHDVVKAGDYKLLGVYINTVKSVLSKWISVSNISCHFMFVFYKLLNLSGEDNNGDTLLHIAARCGHSEVIDLLLAYGAEHDSFNNDGETPAQSCKHVQHSILHEVSNYFTHVRQGSLLKSENWFSQFYLNVRDKFGKTIMHWAVNDIEILENILAMVRMIPCSLDEINRLDYCHRTPLHYAVENKAINVFCKLLTYGAVYDHRDVYGICPIDLCEDDTIRSYLDYIKRMFESVRGDRVEETLSIIRDMERREDKVKLVSCVVSARDSIAGNTLLHYAVYRGQLNVIYFLLSNGGISNAPNYYNHRPIDYNVDCNIDVNRVFYIIDRLFYDSDMTILEYYNLDVNMRKCLSNVRRWPGNTLFYKFSNEFTCNRYLCCAKWLSKYTTTWNWERYTFFIYR